MSITVNTIINTRQDLEELRGAPEYQQFVTRLSRSINQWKWRNGEWHLETNTVEIKRYDFELSDFPDAPIPEKPDYNPDQIRLESARNSARLDSLQFKLKLSELGLYESVSNYIENGSEMIKIWWSESSVFFRMSDEIAAIASDLGYSDEQVDTIFGVV